MPVAALLLAVATQQRDSTTVTAIVPVMKEAATTCVLAAFAQQGLAVAQNEGGVISTVPHIPNPNSFSRAELVYRALLLPADSGLTRVMFSGTFRAVDAGAMSQAVAGVRVEGVAKPLVIPRKRKESDKGKWGWPKLDVFAAAVGGCAT
ncbi:MAG: hypothetical protein ACREX3_00385 [Gammaproteobacteria bacterium]